MAAASHLYDTHVQEREKAHFVSLSYDLDISLLYRADHVTIMLKEKQCTTKNYQMS